MCIICGQSEKPVEGQRKAAPLHHHAVTALQFHLVFQEHDRHRHDVFHPWPTDREPCFKKGFGGLLSRSKFWDVQSSYLFVTMLSEKTIPFSEHNQNLHDHILTLTKYLSFSGSEKNYFERVFGPLQKGFGNGSFMAKHDEPILQDVHEASQPHFNKSHVTQLQTYFCTNFSTDNITTTHEQRSCSGLAKVAKQTRATL